MEGIEDLTFSRINKLSKQIGEKGSNAKLVEHFTTFLQQV